MSMAKRPFVDCTSRRHRMAWSGGQSWGQRQRRLTWDSL